MGYQLVFWKQQRGNPADPHAVYSRLMEGEEVPGLEALSGDRFVARAGEAFSSGWERLAERAWEGDGASQIETGPRHLLVTMHNVPQEAANGLIDIGREFGCKLYDPQIRYRFEG